MKQTTPNIRFEQFTTEAKPHAQIHSLDSLDPADAERLADVGVESSQNHRAGSFLQMDDSVVHCSTGRAGLEVMGIGRALNAYSWLSDYLWRLVPHNADEYTKRARKTPHEGYFIRAEKNTKIEEPVQSCLYIAQENYFQNVHNIVIAEPESALHIITGCATAHGLDSGFHLGISEFYVKRGASLVFTMIHDWGKSTAVRPRTVIHVEEGGEFVSNYVSLKPVATLQMYPTTRLSGRGAKARFQSVLAAGRGAHLDVGSRVILEAPDTKAEIISRGVVTGGTIIARGELQGLTEGIRAHLECKGLILTNGVMRAIPELTGTTPGVEMSHEAAVGKIDRREIEYLMSRGLDEETAVSTIVHGFLNVEIEGLPDRLKKDLDRVVSETRKDMM